MEWAKAQYGGYYAVSDGVNCDVEKRGRAWFWFTSASAGIGGEIIVRGKATHLALAKGAAEAAVPRVAAARAALTTP